MQPGGTGVILAGTGDPNDVLDSYYGAGILRSTDGGNTWSLIQQTMDLEDGLSSQDYGFVGEGFAGFAWSTVNPQLVVAAVSQAYEGTLVNADRADSSYEGLYYSSDSGATWHLATITDGSGGDVQGPLDPSPAPDGNAATAVVWNPVRQLFVAAVRYHGYYQSTDGITWTRMAAQPGAGLTTQMCPTNSGSTGSIACPIFRGALAVNPQTGDTFAWTVDAEQPGPGTVAGSVRDQRRRLQQPDHHLCPAMEHGGAGDQHPRRSRRRLPTATTTWRWPRCPRSRTRCCWPGPTTCGSAAWPWAACGATPPTPPPA